MQIFSRHEVAKSKFCRLAHSALDMYIQCPDLVKDFRAQNLGFEVINKGLKHENIIITHD